jgi:hypothetical protein
VTTKEHAALDQVFVRGKVDVEFLALGGKRVFVGESSTKRTVLILEQIHHDLKTTHFNLYLTNYKNTGDEQSPVNVRGWSTKSNLNHARFRRNS